MNTNKLLCLAELAEMHGAKRIQGARFTRLAVHVYRRNRHLITQELANHFHATIKRGLDQGHTI